MLRQHKPPPIRRIRISDFGLPDPKRDLDCHQNCITWSLSHALPLQKISSKSVHKFASNPTDRQTDRQTDRTKNITSFFGGGKNFLVRPVLIKTILKNVNCINLQGTGLDEDDNGQSVERYAVEYDGDKSCSERGFETTTEVGKQTTRRGVYAPTAHTSTLPSHCHLLWRFLCKLMSI